MVRGLQKAYESATSISPGGKSMFAGRVALRFLVPHLLLFPYAFHKSFRPETHLLIHECRDIVAI